MSNPYMTMTNTDIVLRSGDQDRDNEVIKSWNIREWVADPALVFTIVDLARSLDDPNAFAELALAEYGYNLSLPKTAKTTQPEKRTAYNILHTVTNDQDEFVPVICIEGESGYHLTDWAWGKDYDVAMEIAKSKNLALGITPREAALIVLSTLRTR